MFSLLAVSVLVSVATSEAKVCPIREEPDGDDYEGRTERNVHKIKFVICFSEAEECCREGCCLPRVPYTYTWEIILSAILICAVVSICTAVCYFCKLNCSDRKDSRSSSESNRRSSASEENDSWFESPINDTTNQSNNVVGRRTPPPPYHVAITLPPSAPAVHPTNAIPSYEEVAQKKIFTIT